MRQLKSEHLFQAVGLVDDRLVEEAADARRTATPRSRWLAAAACLALVLGLSALAMPLLFRDRNSAAISESLPQSPAAATADAAPVMEAAPEEEADIGLDNGIIEEPAAAPAPSEAPAGAAGAAPAGKEDGITGGAMAEERESVNGAGIFSVPSIRLDGSALTARRALTLDAAGGCVLDRYTLENPTGQTVTQVLSLPLSGDGAERLTVKLDGEALPVLLLSATPSAGEASADALQAIFDVTVPAQGTAELEVAYPIEAAGAFALEAGSPAITETTFRLMLPEGHFLTGSTLPGDPTRGPVALDRQAYELRIE